VNLTLKVSGLVAGVTALSLGLSTAATGGPDQSAVSRKDFMKAFAQQQASARSQKLKVSPRVLPGNKKVDVAEFNKDQRFDPVKVGGGDGKTPPTQAVNLV